MGARTLWQGIAGWRPRLSPTLAALLLSAWFLLLLNRALWRAILPLFHTSAAGGVGFLLSLTLFLACYLNLLFTLLLWPRIGKPLIVLLLVVSAGVAYFMDGYGVAFDLDMLRNVVETNTSEAAALLTPALLWHLLLLGVVPALAFSRVQLTFRRWPGLLLEKLIAVTATLLVAAGLLAASTGSYIYFARNHRAVYDLFNPYNYLSASVRYARHALRDRNLPLAAIGLDARDAALPADARETLVVLVIGETARAQNFGLQGYARDTTPALRAAGVDYFTAASSCGTATTVSLPCMFSNLGRAHFHERRAHHTQNLLDVLQRAGIDVAWRDNDNGCKGVCQRVPYTNLSEDKVPGLCRAGDCLDAILVRDLPQKLAAMRRPALLVLHLKGSHGPAYYRRYPPAFREFTPTCDTAEAQTCDHAALINTYDNTILYTDHVLGQVIQALAALPPGTQTALVYLSDHGESLGEHDIYLHGMNRALAPSQQTHIPFLFWFSPAWRAAHPQRTACLASRVHAPVSQDNLFDTVLGLFDMQTKVYRPQLDLEAGCAAAPDPSR